MVLTGSFIWLVKTSPRSRWTETYKKQILDSRAHSTRILCEGLAKLPSPPKVLVSASAIGFYGNRGDEIIDEDSVAGKGFLARVARQWEELQPKLPRMRAFEL